MVERDLTPRTRKRKAATDPVQRRTEDQRRTQLSWEWCGRLYPRAAPGVHEDDDWGSARVLDYWQAAGVYLSRESGVHICGVWLYLFCASNLLQISASGGPGLQNTQVSMRRSPRRQYRRGPQKQRERDHEGPKLCVRRRVLLHVAGPCPFEAHRRGEAGYICRPGGECVSELRNGRKDSRSVC